jgi:hypothetical protein
MARKGLLSVVTNLEGLPRAGAPGVGMSSSATGGAEAALATGRTFGKISDELAKVGNEIGRYADKAAIREGAQAGALAGMDPEFRPRGDGTLYSEAYDKAGLENYGASVRVEVENDILTGGDLDAKRNAWISRVPAELKPDVDLMFKRGKLALSRQQTREQAARIDGETIATVSGEIETAFDGVIKRAMTLGLDKSADDALATDIKQIEVILDRRRPDGSPVVKPRVAKKMMEDLLDRLTVARTEGTFSRMPDLQSRGVFLDELAGDKGEGSYADPFDDRDDDDDDGEGIVDPPPGMMRLGGPEAQEDVKAEDAVEAASPPEERSRDVISGDPRVVQLAGEDRVMKVRDIFIAKRLKTEVGRTVKMLVKGFDIKPEKLDAMRLALSYGGHRAAKLQGKLEAAINVQKFTKTAKRARPEELDKFVRDEYARMRNEGADPESFTRLQAAEQMLREQKRWLKNDPAGWADRVGILPATDLDLSSPEKAQETLTARMAEAESVGAYYRQPPQYLRPHQKKELATAISQGGPRALATVGTIAEIGGSKAEKIFKELGDEAPIVAKIGGLVVKNNGPSGVTEDALNGVALTKTEGFKALAPDKARARDWSLGVTNGALGRSPREETAAVDLTNAIYEVRARRQAIGGTGDEKLWKSIFREVIGERTKGNEQYGGVVGAKRNAIVLPSYVKRSTWNEAVRMIDIPDLERAGLPLPVAGDGLPIDINRVRNATLVQVDDGQYALATGDPNTPGQERFIQQLRPGETEPRKGGEGIYILDMKALAPVLAQRRPDFFDTDTIPRMPMKRFMSPIAANQMMKLGGPGVHMTHQAIMDDQAGVHPLLDGMRKGDRDRMVIDPDDVPSPNMPGVYENANASGDPLEQFMQGEMKRLNLEGELTEDALTEIGRNKPTDMVLEAIEEYAKRKGLKTPWERDKSWLKGSGK